MEVSSGEKRNESHLKGIKREIVGKVNIHEFKYLGSNIQSNGQCTREVKKRLQAGMCGDEYQG